MVSTTDASGNVTTYSYNADTNVLEWVQYPENTNGDNDTVDTRTHYTYDEMYRMATARAQIDSETALTASYTYTDDLLTSIATPSTTYNFTYGDFALRQSVKIGERTLAAYSYTERDNYLSALDYGNGDKVEYTYDDKGRVTKQTYEDGATVSYKYDNSGALATVTDSATGRTTTYYYDATDRLMKYVESGTDYNHSVAYTYDNINNLTAQVETINGVETTTGYTYDDDNRVTSVTAGGTEKVYTYDSLGRVETETVKQGDNTILTTIYTYENPSSDTTTSRVATKQITAGSYSVTYSYTYDDNGNILSVRENSNNAGYVLSNTTSYAYDAQNQLIRENDSTTNHTYTWEYDNAGNIQNRKEYAYTTVANLENQTPEYTTDYDYDTQWKDLLVEYDGEAITYDEIGNPTSFIDMTYTWQHGRQLAALSYGSNNWVYTYNADGMRTSRVNGDTVYTYVYNGSQLVKMTKNDDVLTFTYDANGTPMTVTWNGTTYYYVTNLQGDVEKIVSSTGALMVSYAYDAWGYPGMSITELEELNPLRYRGYVYDTEYSYYYLQSRYYDPYIGRFINGDAFNATGQGLLGNNMFAYCNNSPVLLTDSEGTRATVGANPNTETEKERDLSFSLRNKESRRWAQRKPSVIGDPGGGVSVHKGSIAICTDGSNGQQVPDKYWQATTAYTIDGEYVDAYAIPYVVIPMHNKTAKLGDKALLINYDTGMCVKCIIGDVGPERNGWGEVSIAAIWETGNPNHMTANHAEGLGDNYEIFVYPGTKNEEWY